MTTNFNFTLAFLSLVAGFLPALVWLWFWLKEDRERPEPKLMILKTFIAGGLAVVVAFVVQQATLTALPKFGLNPDLILSQIGQSSFLWSSFGLLLGWAFIEELVKYLAASFSAFHNKSYDEPVDAMIYIIVAAIGFAAVENTLFLISAITSGEATLGFLLVGNMRFLGATVVHIVSSAFVGGFVAIAYYLPFLKRSVALVIGLILASVLHAIFNFFIINSNGFDMLKIFVGLWLLAIIVIYIFERVKLIMCNRDLINN